jgi:hypothetical protein
MKYTILLLFCLLAWKTFSQNFNLYEFGKFQKNKITGIKVTNDTIEIKCYLESSESCACESWERFYLTRNASGDFICHPYDDEDNFIQANVYDGKIKSILIKYNAFEPCCSLVSGIYLMKPAPAAGSKVTPKLTSLNAAPKRFLDFWETFQAKMNLTDSIIKHIDFPYAINCSFLDDSEISQNQFKENGVEIYVNGNAFISKTFQKSFYPNNKGLAIVKYVDGYMSELMRAFITNKYENLENIYVVSELPNFETESGYKAYFRESNGSFYFIGFEGMEQGD